MPPPKTYKPINPGIHYLCIYLGKVPVRRFILYVYHIPDPKQPIRVHGCCDLHVSANQDWSTIANEKELPGALHLHHQIQVNLHASLGYGKHNVQHDTASGLGDPSRDISSCHTDTHVTTTSRGLRPPDPPLFFRIPEDSTPRPCEV